MFQGNPILTMLIFGLPGAFFSMLIYVTCCSDWNGVDPEEEGEDELLDDEEGKYTNATLSCRSNSY